MAPTSLSTERRAGGLQLVTSTPHYGGRRWWFICPLARNDGGPPRRVEKLYLPSGGKYFGSREGYGLTYASCQESGKNGRLWRALVAEFGIDEKALRRLMRDKAS